MSGHSDFDPSAAYVVTHKLVTLSFKPVPSRSPLPGSTAEGNVKLLLHITSCIPSFFAIGSFPAHTGKQVTPFPFMLDTTQETKKLTMNET